MSVLRDIFNADDGKARIIQETVPGKQISLAHIIASPSADLYDRLGIDECGAIGIFTVTPKEAAIIAADIATKAANVEIGFLDRFTGSLVIYGDVASVEEGAKAILDVLETMLGFPSEKITRA